MGIRFVYFDNFCTFEFYLFAVHLGYQTLFFYSKHEVFCLFCFPPLPFSTWENRCGGFNSAAANRRACLCWAN